MDTKYYSIRGTLAICCKDDFFRNGKIVENKTFYIKDENNLLFKDRYFIGSIYHLLTPKKIEITENYYINQIEYLLARKLIYKLEDNYDSLKYNFKLYLQTATEFDLFYGSTNFMILNTTYYCIDTKNQIRGPFYIEGNNNGENFRKFLNKGLLLVPTKKQTFELFKIATAS